MDISINDIFKNKLFESVDKSFFENLNISKIFTIEKYNKNELILDEGDRADKLFMIIKGNVKISKNLNDTKRVTVNRLNKDDFFGELGIILPKHKRTASVIAQSEVVLASIGQDNLWNLINRCKQIETNIYKNIARIIENSDKKVSSKRMKEKIFTKVYENFNKSEDKIKTRFTVEKGGKFLVIHEKEIVYFSSEHNYSFIHLYDRNYFYNKSLKEVQGYLDSNKFTRIHRKYIISCNKVDEIIKKSSRKFYVVLNDKNKTRLKVGRTYIDNLKAYFDL